MRGRFFLLCPRGAILGGLLCHAACWVSAAAAADTPAVAPASASVAVQESDAAWIWSPAQDKGAIPAGDCYFRKAFDALDVEAAQIQIACDNRYELYVNGRLVARGADWRQMQIVDVTPSLKPGRNVVAVKATNVDAGDAGLVARVLLKQKSGTFVGHSSDDTWRTSLREFADWQQPQFNDRDWVAAAQYGALGAALPWGNEVVVAGEGARFVIDREFVVERLMRDAEVGSLIAMTFDASGALIVSREGGGLARIVDSDRNGTLDKATPYCDEINSAQGLLALGSRLLVVGHGPEGSALYRLRDADRDGRADEVKKLIAFRGSGGEHGPHGLRLGPDGLIYVIVGNFARADAEPAPRSPFRRWYEGDLVQPRYEDAGGHAVGIPAPGGTVFRTDAEGSFVEFFAGGFRNAYDLAFSPQGQLWTYDADMEWDRGAPWYRPTRVNHVPAGAELGWRSGWAKWPEYFVDSLPAALDVGVGSPTGVEFYDHVAFPAKYRGAMFGCDWATGRIHAFHFERRGATWTAQREEFLRGAPLNATDVAVGPDGALYFTTGGRGTDGGVYRVRFTGAPDPQLANLGEGIDRALRQPQWDADWARARIAAVRQSLGDAWGPQLAAAARDPQRPLAERLRAIDLAVCFGPRPEAELLNALAQDAHAEMRAKAAEAIGTDGASEARPVLEKLLTDGDSLVRRAACESLARSGPLPDAANVLPLLADDDRFVAFAASRLLELLPVETWAPTVLRQSQPLAFARGAAALVNVDRIAPTAQAVIARAQRRLQQRDLSAENRLALLRVIQLALHLGKPATATTPTLDDQLLALYPSGEPRVDRELVRLLVHRQVPGAATKFAATLAGDAPRVEKLHVAAYCARLEKGWTSADKVKVVTFYEQARAIEGGYSVDKYVENFARDFLERFTLDEKRQLLSQGATFPALALSILAKLPDEPSPTLLAEIRQLDRQIAPRCPESNAFRRLRVGVIAVLGATTDADSQQYLRSIYDREPEYRDPVAMSLTQHPDGENWKYLVASLRAADAPAAQEIMTALAGVAQRPQEPAPYRDAILLGLRLNENGAAEAARLLRHWSGSEAASDNPTAELRKWQAWYAKKFPDAPPAELPVDAGKDKWSYDELATFLDGPLSRQGDAARGAELFATAQCASCHRCAGRGETMGPDLSAVGQRFQRKEILEAIVFPSHDVSDQYASRIVQADGKQYSGLAVQNADGSVTVLLSTGKKVELKRDAIEGVAKSDLSAMPTGLLNALSLDDVADLFAYLTQPHEEAAAVARRPGGAKQ